MDYQTDQLIRADRDIILSIIPPNSHVLDLGCGDGGLLAELTEKKGIIGRGVDIDEHNLITGIKRGLSVYMGDLDEGLSDYPDNLYDYVSWNPLWNGKWDRKLAEQRFRKYLGGKEK